MTDSYRYKLTSKNLTFLLIATMQEVTILQLTRRASEYSGHDAWLSVLLASLPAFASLFIINSLCSRFPNMTLAEYSDEICGVVLGKIVSFSYIIYAVVYSALVIRIFVTLTSTYLFVRTPVWAVSLIMTLAVLYIFSRDIRAIAWMSEFTQYLLQILWLVVLFGLSRAKLENILPVGDAGVKNIVMGTYGAFFAYLGPEILMVVYPFIQNKKEVLKAGMLAVAFNAIVYTVIALVVTMAFGGEVIKYFVWDFLALIKSYRLPVVERAEFFIAIFWSWLAFRASANQLYMARHTFAKAAGIKEKYQVYLVWGLAAAAFALSFVPKSAAEAFIYSYYTGAAGIFYMLGFPALLLALAALRGVKRVENSN